MFTTASAYFWQLARICSPRFGLMSALIRQTLTSAFASCSALACACCSMFQTPDSMNARITA